MNMTVILCYKDCIMMCSFLMSSVSNMYNICSVLCHIRQYCGEGSGTHSSPLAWKIPWTEEPGGLQSMGLLRVGHN